MIGSDWPHAEGVADPMARQSAPWPGWRNRPGPTCSGANAAWLLGLVTVDLEAAAAERERLRAAYLREPAGRPRLDRPRRPPPGAAVFRRRADHPLLPGSARLPPGRALREPRLQGVDAPVLRPRSRQHARLLRFPRPRARPLHRGAGRVPPPRHLGRPGAVGRGAGPPGRGRHPDADRERDLALLLRSRRRAARADRRGSRLALRHARCTDGRHRAGQPGRQGRRPRAALRLVSGGRRNGDRAGGVGERPASRRRSSARSRSPCSPSAIYEDACALPDEGFLHPALFVDDLDAELARHRCCGGRGPSAAPSAPAASPSWRHRAASASSSWSRSRNPPAERIGTELRPDCRHSPGQRRARVLGLFELESSGRPQPARHAGGCSEVRSDREGWPEPPRQWRRATRRPR